MPSSSVQVFRSTSQMKVQYLSAALTSTDMDEARKMIKTIATDFEAGQIFEGTVVSIKEFRCIC